MAAAIATFCWLPPDRVGSGAARRSGAHVEALDERVCEPPQTTRAEEPAAASDLATPQAHHEILAHREVGEQHAPPIGWQVGRAFTHDRARGSAVEQKLADRRHEAGCGGDDLPSAGTLDADTGEDLASADEQIARPGIHRMVEDQPLADRTASDALVDLGASPSGVVGSSPDATGPSTTA